MQNIWIATYFNCITTCL